MIHRLTVLDRIKSIGVTVFDNREIEVQPDLLIGLVQALMLLGEEMGPVKGELREAELGKYQISILSQDHLAYVAIQDTYDSEPFTSKILQNVIDKYHDFFRQSNFHTQLPNHEEIIVEIADMLETMKFPVDKIESVGKLINEFQLNINSVADTLILTDLDDGIVNIYQQPADNSIVRVLMEIISEIPFERHWIGQTKLKEAKIINNNSFTNELWLIYRIGLTDFCIMGRAYYNMYHEHDNILIGLDRLVEQISSILFDEL